MPQPPDLSGPHRRPGAPVFSTKNLVILSQTARFRRAFPLARGGGNSCNNSAGAGRLLRREGKGLTTVLARVGKILGAVAIFLLAFYPVQALILVSVTNLSGSLLLGATAPSIFLSLLSPLVMLKLNERAARETKQAKNLRETAQLIYLFGIGIMGFVALVALVQFRSIIQQFRGGHLLREIFPFTGHLILLMIFLLSLFPLRLLWTSWRMARQDDSELARVLRRALWVVVPLFLAGVASTPLYWLTWQTWLVFG